VSDNVITIFGSGRVRPGDSAYKVAEQTGELLARAGFAIANGGYGGTMQAAAKGARRAGGEVIGVTCSAFVKGRVNKYVTREIVAESLQQRLDTLVKLGAGYVILPGGTGTLLELAAVWELKNKSFLNSEKPVIIIGGFWGPLLELIAGQDIAAARHISHLDSPCEAVEMLSAIIKRG